MIRYKTSVVLTRQNQSVQSETPGRMAFYYALNNSVMKKIFVPIAFMVALNGCIIPVYDPPRGSIELHNYSDRPIYVYSNDEDTLPLTPALELFHSASSDYNKDYDAWGNPMPVPTMYTTDERIDAYNYGKVWTGGTHKHPSIGHPKNPDNKLYLFFITEETMRNHTWEEIWKDQLYVKKDSVTEGEMEKTLWRYTYFPPKE